MTRTVPISVVETPEFLSASRKLMTDEERALLVEYLAYNPTSGDLIPGTGGVRKLRWGLEGEASAAVRGWPTSITTSACRFSRSPPTPRTSVPI